MSNTSKRLIMDFICFSGVLITVCGVQAEDGKPYALKDVFKERFLVGAAISDNQVLGKDKNALDVIAAQFNTITPENCLKWDTVHPSLYVYNFEQADRFVALGQKHNMFIVGHILLDIEQVPEYVFQGANGNRVDRDTLLNRIRDHIYTVVGRYKGRIHAWHIVNEAIGNDGRWRNTRWFDVIGDDYVIKAFAYAHQADPNVELYYNGHDILTKEATDSIIRLVRDIKGNKGRIDGIGVQAHWKLDYPSLDQVEKGIVNLAQSGLKMMITEMDITVLPRTGTAEQMNPYPDGLPEKIEQQLAQRYQDLFSIFCKHADKIARLNFWGVHDGQSWLNDWPFQGRSDYPLLFDRQLQPKPSFFAVIKTAAPSK